MIPESTKFEETDWEAIQQEQQLAEILKKSEEKLDLPDAEENKEILKTSTKLEQNMKEIQEYID